MVAMACSSVTSASGLAGPLNPLASDLEWNGRGGSFVLQGLLAWKSFVVTGARPPAVSEIGAGREVCYPRAVPREPPLPRAALEYTDALFRVARRLTGRDDDAEDLVQETFARALGSHAQYAPGTNLRAWLFRILRNAHIDQYRRSRNSPLRGSLPSDEEPTEVAASSLDPLRGDQELERLRSVVAEDIEAALASLSIDARAVILLDLEGLTESELAEALGCTIGTVKSRLSRARAALRVRLSDYSR
jgi:RNA polymerase sigma-70 factor (ECF subfamily)